MVLYHIIIVIVRSTWQELDIIVPVTLNSYFLRHRHDDDDDDDDDDSGSSRSKRWSSFSVDSKHNIIDNNHDDFDNNDSDNSKKEIIDDNWTTATIRGREESRIISPSSIWAIEDDVSLRSLHCGR